jgi:para-nitrobenzyl esterase
VQTYNLVLAQSGCQDLECLLALDGAELMALPAVANGTWGPIVDAVELRDYPYALLLANATAAVPVLMGANRDEGATFIGATPHGHNMTEADFEAYLSRRYGFAAAELATLKHLYNGSDPGQYVTTPCCSAWWWAASRAVGDEYMACSARLAALAYARRRLPAFAYSFDHIPEQPDNEFVYHSAEIAFVFHVDSLMAPDEVPVASIVSRYWLNFAGSSDPNQGAFPPPTPWPSALDGTLHLAAQPTADPAWKEAQCAFWANHFVFE